MCAEMLTVTGLVHKFKAYYGIQSSLSHPKKHVNRPLSKPSESRPCVNFIFPFRAVFSGAFAKIANCECFFLHVCSSVRVEKLCSLRTDFHEIWYLRIFHEIWYTIIFYEILYMIIFHEIFYIWAFFMKFYMWEFFMKFDIWVIFMKFDIWEFFVKILYMIIFH